MSLKFPPLVRSGVFFFVFLSFKGAEQLCFCCVFLPYSKVGNSRIHSTRSDDLSFYGTCAEAGVTAADSDNSEILHPKLRGIVQLC